MNGDSAATAPEANTRRYRVIQLLIKVRLNSLTSTIIFFRIYDRRPGYRIPISWQHPTRPFTY